MTREAVLQQISEMVRHRASREIGNIDEPAWANALAEEILDLVEEGYEL